METKLPEIFKPFQTNEMPQETIDVEHVQEMSEYQSYNEVQEPADDEFAQEMSEYQNHSETHEQEIEAYRISEGVTTEEGLYLPGHVEEINPEAKDLNPEMRELSHELDTWIEQSETMSCAVASQTMAINQLEHSNHSEQEFLQLAREKHWYDNGTTLNDVGNIAEEMGADVKRYHGVDPSELKIANDPSTKVLAAVDSTILTFPECNKRCQPDHCVQVLRVESTQDGEFVILNDPGHKGGKGAIYPMEIFAKACSGDVVTIRKEMQA